MSTNNKTNNQKSNTVPNIVIYNLLLDEGIYKLTTEELYFYTLLATRQSRFLDMTETTLSILAESQTIYAGVNSTRNISKIKKIIISLNDKKVITIQHTVESVKANSLLHITLNSLAGGYELVSNQLWSQVDTVDELYVLVTLQRFKTFEKSIDGWAKMLGYGSANTAREKLHDMINSGKIQCVEGKKSTDDLGNIKQRPTNWKLGESNKQDNSKLETINNTKSDESTKLSSVDVVSNDSVTVIVDDTNNTKLAIEWGNWNGRDDLTFDDYYLYVTQSHVEDFKTKADARIKRITKNGDNEPAQKMISKMLADAEALVASKERDKKSQEQQRLRDEVIRNKDKGIIFKDNQHNLVLVETDRLKDMSIDQIIVFESLVSDVIDNYENEIVLDRGNGWNRGLFFGCTDETIKKLINKMIEQFNQSGEVDGNQLKDDRLKILAENNKSLAPNVEHEGDYIEYDSYSVVGTNVSLKARELKIKSQTVRDRNDISHLIR